MLFAIAPYVVALGVLAAYLFVRGRWMFILSTVAFLDIVGNAVTTGLGGPHDFVALQAAGFPPVWIVAAALGLWVMGNYRRISEFAT